jgi:DNA-binding LytR/AlgR family response regulator
MPVIRIAICDDEPREAETAKHYVQAYLSGNRDPAAEISVFSSAAELLFYIEKKGSFDILLLDVYMPGVLGTEAAKELRDTGDNCQIIFLTTSRDHAVDAFSLNAAHYLVKPYTETDMFAALHKALGNLSIKDASYINVKTSDGFYRVELNKLIYSETDNHLQRLYLSDGRIISTRKSSAELFELLEEDPRFYKCGSTYIINMDFVAQLSSKGVSFSTGTKITLLSRKYAEFKKLYMDYSCCR